MKVIDFGSSCFLTDHLSTYVQSRSYRAPEVILGMPYDQRIDIWSLGCILAELYTGKVLFQNDSVQTLLARLVGIMGQLDRKYLKRGKYSAKYFTKNFTVLYDKRNGAVEYLYPKKSSLRRRLKTDDALFLDFMTRLLRVNARERYVTIWFSTGCRLRIDLMKLSNAYVKGRKLQFHILIHWIGVTAVTQLIFIFVRLNRMLKWHFPFMDVLRKHQTDKIFFIQAYSWRSPRTSVLEVRFRKVSAGHQADVKIRGCATRSFLLCYLLCALYNIWRCKLSETWYEQQINKEVSHNTDVYKQTRCTLHLNPVFISYNMHMNTCWYSLLLL